jgi:DNA-binding transcriptional LysR family regulator
MDLRHLRYFAAVAAARSFTRAAEALRVAQPPLSRQIQDLEAEIGAVLFDRSQRPLQLTEAGRFFHTHAAQVLERTEQMRELMRRFLASDRRHFVVGFVPSTIYGPLPAIIRKFRSLRPELEISLAEMATVEQMDALKEGRIDVGFGRVRFEDPAIRREIVMEEPLIVALPRAHRLAGRAGRVSLAALSRDSLVVYPQSPRPSYADQILALFHDRNLWPRVGHEVRELQTAIGLVAAQAGVCIVPQSVQRLQRDDVIYRKLADRNAISPIIISYRENDQSLQLTALREIVRQTLVEAE